MAFEFYYNQMNTHDKEIYRTLYEGIKQRKPRVTIYENDPSRIYHVRYQLFLDNPQLFYCDSAYDYSNNSTFIDIKQKYLLSELEQRIMAKQMRNQIKEIITDGELSFLSDYQKEVQIHDYLCRRIEYDKLSYQFGENYIEIYKRAHTVLGPLLDRTGVCDGVARAFKLICDFYGIPCICVVNDTHAWNIIWIDNYPYHVDVTWDLSKNMSDISHNYLNLSDKQIETNHSLNTRYGVPVCLREYKL